MVKVKKCILAALLKITWFIALSSANFPHVLWNSFAAENIIPWAANFSALQVLIWMNVCRSVHC